MQCVTTKENRGNANTDGKLKDALYVFHYKNDTYEPTINRELRQLVIREVNRRNNFKIAPDGPSAKYWIQGSVTYYTEIARLIDNAQRITHYEMILYSSCFFQKNAKTRGKNLEGQSENFSERRLFSNTVNYGQDRSFIRRLLLEKMANSITNTAEQFFLTERNAP